MRPITGIAVVVAFLFSAHCGPGRIQKLPVPAENEIRSIRLMAEGDELLRQDKDHLAMLKYLEASELNPYYEVIFNKLAVAYSRLQMFYQAERAVNRALGLAPDYAHAYNTLGIVKLAGRNLGGAIKAFRKAIDLQPEVPSFYVNLGWAYVQQSKAAEAKDAFLKAVELDPKIFENRDYLELSYSTPDPMAPEKFFVLAVLHAELGNIDGCLDYLGQAIANGFDDFERLKSEKAFRRFENDDKYISFLRRYGIPR